MSCNHPSLDKCVCHATHPSLDTSVCLVLSLSDHPSMSNHLYAIFTSLPDCPSPSDHLYDHSTSLSDCPSLSNHLNETSTHPSTYPSSAMTKHPHNSSQSLAVVNGEQSCKVKKFHRAFTNYSLLLHDPDVSSIYASDSRCVAPPKSGKDTHMTHGIMGDLGGPTLN